MNAGGNWGDPQHNFVDFVDHHFEVVPLAFPIIRQYLPPPQNNFQNCFAVRGLFCGTTPN